MPVYTPAEYLHSLPTDKALQFVRGAIKSARQTGESDESIVKNAKAIFNNDELGIVLTLGALAFSEKEPEPKKS